MPDTSKRSTTTDPLRAPDPLRARGGFADLVGYELMTWEEDLAEIALTVAERHLNRSGLMHGGVLTKLVDRKSVVSGECVSVRVSLGGRRIIKKKKKKEQS